MKKVILSLLCISAVTLAHGSGFTPSHSCSQPYKPSRFNSEREAEKYRQDAARYQSCLKKFIAEQIEESKRHQEAIKKAAEEWERFVLEDLK